MIAKLAWRNTWFKPLNTLLSVILLASSVAIITVLILLQKQFEEQFSSNADNVDLVLGAQGSPLQLVLSAVYQVDAPTGNIDYSEAKKWMQNPFVATAIPLAFGDNYKGFKIIGTTPAYIEQQQTKLKGGIVFKKDFEVVLGSQVAAKLNLKIGDQFFGSHGDAAEGEVHESHPYKVVGILQSSGKVSDNLILCMLSSVWAMHHEEGHAPQAPHTSNEAMPIDKDAHNHDHDHDHDHEVEHHDEVITEEGQEITAVLLKFRNKMGIVTWPRIIAQNTKMQAASPGVEINRLFTLFGIGLQALTYLAYGIMLISGISIFIALFNTLKERKFEFALMRIQGASRWQLFGAVVIESIMLCCLGYFFGTIIGRIALYFISQSSDEEFKIAFNPFEMVWSKEGLLFVVTLLVGIFAAMLPAIKAYRLNISKTLANA